VELIDTHTHLFVEQFDEDRHETVQRALQAGVKTMLLPNIDVDTIEPMLRLCSEFPSHCYPMIGLHPGSVGSDWKQKLITVRHALETNTFVAIGEIGMDLYWDTTYFQEQKFVFEQQVKWAKEFGLPIVIHAREAFDEIFALLDELNDEQLTGVFHCFTGTVNQAKKIHDYGGFKLGIGGVLTYKKSGLDEVVKEVPLEWIILETDAPYLSPVPHRGKRNESAYLPVIAEKLADIKHTSVENVAKITRQNALELFPRLPHGN
jgi:TatD DNase family protein